MRLHLLTISAAFTAALSCFGAIAQAGSDARLSLTQTPELAVPREKLAPASVMLITEAPPLRYDLQPATRELAAVPLTYTPGREAKPWRADIWYGALNPGNFTDLMIDPASTKMTSDQIIGFTFGREIFDHGYGFTFDLGVMGAHRVDEGGFEIGMPMTVTFNGFPWRERLPTRLAVSVGPSFVTRITPTEKRKDQNNKGSKLLNMFSPEVEVGIPDTDWSGFFRLHHRSGIFGLIDGVSGGSTYLTFGFRHRFGMGDTLPWK